MKQLEKMEYFFAKDAEIKKLLSKYPRYDVDITNMEDIIRYEKDILNTIKSIKYDFDKICEYFDDSSKNIINQKFNIILNEFVKSSGNLEKLNQFCTKYMTSMDVDLVNEVYNSFKGYYMFKPSIGQLLNKSSSINEMLHIYHSNIINDEKNYQSIPFLAEKINNENEIIRLYGDQDDDALKIFNEYPLDMPSGSVDILGLSNSNKIVMMIRDRGHALTIEIDKSEVPYVYVSYYIPKITNLKQVNQLPGVLKVSKETYDNNHFIPTHGVYQTTLDELSYSVIKLISQVPMDYEDDYVYEGSKCR